jgi:hypothetical protein
MTITTAPLAPAGTRRDARLYRDLHGILGLVQVTPGLPRWSICEDLAAFFFAGLPAEEVPQSLRDAETVLSYATGATFETRKPDPIGSTRHFIRTAELPSGLRLELVALAETVNEADYREDVPEMAGAAA